MPTLTRAARSCLNYLGKIESSLVTVILSVMTVTVFMQVFFRYVVKASLPFSEELARYLMVWAVFIGASMGARQGAHIGVEAIANLFPKSLKKFSIILSGSLSVLFCIVITWLGFQVVSFIMQTGQKSPSMEIPMFYAYLAVPVGCMLMGIRFIEATVYRYRDLQNEEEGQ